MNWTLDVKIRLFYLNEIQILTNQNSRFELKKNMDTFTTNYILN